MLLLHVCCGPCLTYPSGWLAEQGMPFQGYFFNPNIHPYVEFKKRMQALRQYADANDITVEVDEQLLVLFGKQLHNDAIDRDYRQRLQRACQIYHKHPAIQIQVLGGTTPGNHLSESAAGRNFMLAAGIPEHAIAIEEQSRHTLENLSHARSLWSQDATPPALLSNRYHLARISTLACGMGLPHSLCAAESQLNLSSRIALKLLLEAYYLHWYWVGRQWSILTHNRNSLTRIS